MSVGWSPSTLQVPGRVHSPHIIDPGGSVSNPCLAAPLPQKIRKPQHISKHSRQKVTQSNKKSPTSHKTHKRESPGSHPKSHPKVTRTSPNMLPTSGQQFAQTSLRMSPKVTQTPPKRFPKRRQEVTKWLQTSHAKVTEKLQTGHKQVTESRKQTQKSSGIPCDCSSIVYLSFLFFASLLFCSLFILFMILQLFVRFFFFRVDGQYREPTRL